MSTQLPPTPRQQQYIRELALARGISFTPPRTRSEASEVIDQLKRHRPQPANDRLRETRQVQHDMANRRGDNAQVRPEELTGHGSTATWSERTSHFPNSSPTRKPNTDDGDTGESTKRDGETNPPVEITRYTISAGERVIQGQRILGVVRLTDISANGEGRRYVIERELTLMTELRALVTDYVSQAAEHDAIPAEPCWTTTTDEG